MTLWRGIDMASITEALAKVPFRITNPELIPTERYYDPAFFELENKHLWPHAWQMAGRLEEIPQVGDYTVYNILEHSVLLIHTKNGVKAFKNACRHRGVRLATKPGHCGTTGLVCPFHGWRWNEDGESTFIFGREVFSDELLERAEVDLVPIRTEFWAGCAAAARVSRPSCGAHGCPACRQAEDGLVVWHRAPHQLEAGQ
jgi:nitrite reductase/ring-hydroxylating ferredoxin subunit